MCVLSVRVCNKNSFLTKAYRSLPFKGNLWSATSLWSTGLIETENTTVLSALYIVVAFRNLAFFHLFFFPFFFCFFLLLHFGGGGVGGWRGAGRCGFALSHELL